MKAGLPLPRRDEQAQDLPRRRHALAWQQRLVEQAYRQLGRQAQVIARLTLEAETLKRVIDDQDDANPWDQGDTRW
jgi:hypothetical protein